jgi:hypothetical protein
MVWIEGLFAVAMLVVGGLAVKALRDLLGQIEAMKRSVEDIGTALERQNVESKRTLQAIEVAVGTTASSLGKIEAAMPGPRRR